MSMHNVKPMFKVSLINGAIEATLETEIEPSPYALYDNFYRANYCSLGIILQNIAEDEFKNERETEVSFRSVFGEHENIYKTEAIKTRKDIYELHNEYFI